MRKETSHTHQYYQTRAVVMVCSVASLILRAMQYLLHFAEIVLSSGSAFGVACCTWGISHVPRVCGTRCYHFLAAVAHWWARSLRLLLAIYAMRHRTAISQTVQADPSSAMIVHSLESPFCIWITVRTLTYMSCLWPWLALSTGLPYCLDQGKTASSSQRDVLSFVNNFKRMKFPI